MTTSQKFTLVIGATGTTGSRVAARLAAAGRRVRAGSRRAGPARGSDSGQGPVPVRFDWDNPTSFAGALQDADRIYLIPPLGAPDPAAVMLPFLREARTAGVHRAVLLSSSAIPAGGPSVGQVHQALPGLFSEWAVLRPSWFMQNFTGDHAHARTIRADGTIRTAAGDGRVGFVDADDIAAVAVHALTAGQAPNTDLVITGPQALSYDDIAAVLTRTTGRPVTHHRLTYEQMRDRLAADMPAEFAALLAGLDRSIAEGAEDRTTDTVLRLTGHAPRSFRAVAERELPRLPN
ncbi:NAD(P)H-binding protein [Streptomyces sp. H39-S7]|uniref:NAD(P)H-binding protein n=1 Tax=Streptomyces sp. H39-S7 TaxID=3004357 RepID=UPI0022AF5CF6|nr:NAD(P)H-binding protein [Streptomyces sp. H39-S7]MCZ4121947.1 NAD(P)H-binding protein [Streptomyces sp. H39-S7]